MAKIKVVPLVCPDCGNTLLGLRWDKMFFCMACMQGYRPAETNGKWDRFPVKFPTLGKDSVEPSFYLPFWEFKVAGKAVPSNRQQELAIKLLDEIDHAWVAGFAAIRAGYFGDIGQIFTEKKIRLTPAQDLPNRAFVAGCSRSIEDAKKYVELYISLILDKRADITGLKLDLFITEPALWAIPFAERGDKVVDLIMGNELPVFSIDDLEDIKRVVKKR